MFISQINFSMYGMYSSSSKTSHGTRRIYIDLDNTLIDSTYRYGEEIKIAEKYGFSTEEYKSAGERLRKSSETRGYNFKQIFHFLAEAKPDLSFSMYKELDALLDRKYPFSDTEEFLASFPREELIILTQGDLETQQRKIKAHNFQQFVKKVEVVAGGQKPHAIIPEKHTFFLDDTPRQIDLVKNFHTLVHCIQVRNPPPWEKQTESLLKDVHLPSLTDAAKYINENS